MHMMLNAPGHERLVTHIFVKDSPTSIPTRSSACATA
jgi:hypothetical protein